jgi:tRNA 2-thiouridine synthesizing protein A
MSTEYEIAETLDVTGLNCPMPVLRTKQAVDGLESGDVLEVLATDSGSVSDIESWAASLATVDLLRQLEVEENGTPIFKHYVRKVTP